MKTMKKKDTARAVAEESRIWCETCNIRIAPTEERIVRNENQYHLRCWPKPHRSTDHRLLHG